MIQTQPASLLDLAWRAVFRLGFPLARRCWRLRERWRPGAAHQGALVAVHVGPALLLLRSSYRTEWNFPGGSIRSGESAEAAARRELVEEIGLAAPVLRSTGEASGIWEGRSDQVSFFELRLQRLDALRLDNREIVEARLVPLEDALRMRLTVPVAIYLERLKIDPDPNQSLDEGSSRLG